MPIKDLDPILLCRVAVRDNGDGIVIEPILLSYTQLAEELSIRCKLIVAILHGRCNPLVSVFQSGLIDTMLSQEDGGTRKAAQDTLDKLILARLIPAILSLMVWNDDLILLPLLYNGVQSLCGKCNTNPTC